MQLEVFSSLDIKTKVKQKFPPFVGVKSRTAGSVDAEMGVKRVKDGDGEGEGRGEWRSRWMRRSASEWMEIPMTEDDNNRSSVFFHFALLSYY